MIEKNQILEQLKSIHYPGFNRDIVSFGMVENIYIQDSTIIIDLKINSNIIINHESKNVNIEKIKTTLCSTVESTEAILNGVVDVGRCYTPGKFVKLTIGIKPETIVSASRLNQNMTNSRNSSGSGSSNNSGSKSSGFNSMDGYSNYNSDF